MVGMSSMLLTVLFSKRPSFLRNICVGKTPKTKTVFDTRCRCDQCVEKRKQDKKVDSLAEQKENNEPPVAANKSLIELQTLKNRKTGTEGLGQHQPEEIIISGYKLSNTSNLNILFKVLHHISKKYHLIKR